jgi:hypothetical protein
MVIAGIDEADPVFTKLHNKPYKAANFPKTYSYKNEGGDGGVTTVNLEDKLRRAFRFVAGKSALHVPCNNYFKGLPGHKTLADLLTENRILIGALVPKDGDINDGSNYAKLPAGNTAGRQIIINLMHVVAFEVAFIAATLVHELAHVGGATTDNSPLNPRSQDAEKAVNECLLPQQFDPTVFGYLMLRRDQRPA